MEDKDEAMAMMFALLQEQHKIQMEVMATASQKAMDAMMEQMNALISMGHGKPADKENMLLVTGNVSNRTASKKKGTKESAPTVESTFSISRRIVTNSRLTQASVE